MMPASKIQLSTLNGLPYQSTNIIYVKKIATMINDQVYRKIFSSDNLNDVVKYFIKQEKIIQNNDLKEKGRRTKYANVAINRSFDGSNRKCRKRNMKVTGSVKPLTQEEYNFAPIRLYQHNLLTKYCYYKNSKQLPPINFDCTSYLNQQKNHMKMFTVSRSKEMGQESAYDPVFQTIPLMSITNNKKTYTKRDQKKDQKIYSSSATVLNVMSNTVTELRPLANKMQRIKESKLIHNDNAKFTSDNIKITNKNINSLPELVFQEPSILTGKTNVKNKPRLSKENIQELMRNAMQNAMNKQRTSDDIDGRKNSIKLKFEQKRISTTSESPHFSESGDMETPVNLTQNSISFDSDNLAANESILTQLALKGTLNIIFNAGVKENRTWSGTIFNLFNKQIRKTEVRYAGNIGFIDGVNLRNRKFKRIVPTKVENFKNETFTALSHMYSLKKLLERRSLNADRDSKLMGIPTFMKSIIGSHEESDTSSSESLLITDNESFDVRLIKNFREKMEE